MSSFVSKSSGWQNVDENPEEVVRYLNTANALLAPIKSQSLRALRLKPGAAVLDVGCGIGRDAETLLAEFGAGRVVGLDFGEDLIAQANERTHQSSVRPEFVVGNAEAIEFADATFDACRTDRVLQHLVQPHRAIAEMVRVTKPGGRIVALEPDWHTVAITSGDLTVAQEVSRQIALNQIKQGDMGRRLIPLLADAGCQNLEIEVGVSIIRDLRTADYILHFGHALDALITAGVVTEERGKTWWQSLQEMDRKGSFFATNNLIIGSGVVA